MTDISTTPAPAAVAPSPAKETILKRVEALPEEGLARVLKALGIAEADVKSVVRTKSRWASSKWITCALAVIGLIVIGYHFALVYLAMCLGAALVAVWMVCRAIEDRATLDSTARVRVALIQVLPPAALTADVITAVMNSEV